MTSSLALFQYLSNKILSSLTVDSSRLLGESQSIVTWNVSSLLSTAFPVKLFDPI